jgi:predicted transcriptional regulator
MSRRNNIEICSEILRIAKNGARKSHIVYKANLNSTVVEKYLDSLKSSGLIIGPQAERHLFNTTEKGLKYLNHFKGLEKYLDNSDLNI